jgi:hypothetical protein
MALVTASQLGVLAHPPIGDEGLKVDDARLAVALLYQPPLSEHTGCIVIGPLDDIAPKSADVLLKSLEEPHPSVRAILWAHDIGGVRPTIRSRCLDHWAPPTPEWLTPSDDDLEEAARNLTAAALRGQVEALPPLLARLKGKEWRGIAILVEALSTPPVSPDKIALWERIRALVSASAGGSQTPPGQIEILAALLGV